MYFEVVRTFVRTLGNLDAILDKATRYADARKFSADNFCNVRLAPDMLPFTRQIGIACDAAKVAAAMLSGREAPKFEDNEKTMVELRERIKKTVAFLDTLKVEDFSKTTPKTVCKLTNPQGKAMYANEYLLTRAVPNFFFHVTTAYDILRSGGVDLGKSDYLGQLNLIDA